MGRGSSSFCRSGSRTRSDQLECRGEGYYRSKLERHSLRRKAGSARKEVGLMNFASSPTYSSAVTLAPTRTDSDPDLLPGTSERQGPSTQRGRKAQSRRCSVRGWRFQSPHFPSSMAGHNSDACGRALLWFDRAVSCSRHREQGYEQQHWRKYFVFIVRLLDSEPVSPWSHTITNYGAAPMP